MTQFGSFTGQITGMQNVGDGDNQDGCIQMYNLQNEDGVIANFIVTPNTYVFNQEMLSMGDIITGYYDTDAPMILIYPPRHPALVMVKKQADLNMKVSYFNNELVSQDHQLALNLHPYTRVTTTNGQTFMGNPADHDLLVLYGPATKSIPAQTTPYQVVVLCRDK